MNDKQKLMKQIQICDFTLFETALYLDTHKTDKDAIAFYKKHKALLEEYRKEYVAKYGPINITDVNNDSVWEWVNSAWPWEYESKEVNNNVGV